LIYNNDNTNLIIVDNKLYYADLNNETNPFKLLSNETNWKQTTGYSTIDK
jgi:hypothetical protein